MNPDRWARIRGVLDQALDQPTEMQVPWVRAACSDETDLKSEVLRLLQAHHSSDEFLDGGAAHLLASLALEQGEEVRPALAKGLRLVDRFEIRAFVNRGGMGEVYEAWDVQLNEAVAVKTILPAISSNPAVIERFKHEVRHAREVSHPNICRVHELFCHQPAEGAPVWFLSMELLQGVTLAQRLRDAGYLPPDLALRIAEQTLAGLEAAHSRGLVHRDYKSSNVMLVGTDHAETRAVITDFGLAITHLPGGMAASDRIARGTPGYMAPEQRHGNEVGASADQYAFGVVLFEMATGLLPQSVNGSHRRLRLNGYPARWSKVIRRCTAEKPECRFPNMAAVRTALFPVFLTKRVFLPAGMVLLAATVIWPILRRTNVAPNACIICDVAQITPDVDKSESASLSQDGNVIAYSSDRAESGNLDIFVQRLPSGSLTRVTEDPARDTAPSLSPNGKIVAFRSERAGGGIYVASTENSQAPRLLVPGGRDPKIAPDGKSLLYWTGDPDSSVPSGKVFRMDLAGGPAQLIAASLLDARYPVWSEDGRQIMLTGCPPGAQVLPDCFDWWMSDVTGKSLQPTNAFSMLRSEKFMPGRFSSMEWRHGQMFFSAAGPAGRLGLAAVALQASRPYVLGKPRWLLQEDAGDLSPSVAVNRRIAFTRTSGALHIWKMQGLDGTKRPHLTKVTDDPEVDGSPYSAGDGHFLVYARGRGLQRSIMQRDMMTGQEVVLVRNGTPVQSPVLDESHSWLAYQQTEPNGSSAVYAGRVGGSMKRLCTNCSEPFGWSGKGATFFYREGVNTLSLADAESAQHRAIVTDTRSSLADASWSPQTGNLLLVQTRGNQKQITVQHRNKETLEEDGTIVTVHDENSTWIRPRWSSNGQQVVYVSNQDGFLCLYARRFDQRTRSFGRPAALAHFHHQRASIDEVLPRVLNLSVAGDTLFLNLGEQNSTIQVGSWKGP